MVEYKPGVCNIGKNEIRERYALAFMGFAITALLISSVVIYHLPRWSLLISIVPLIFGFEGFYQGRLHFCTGFAAAGVYDAESSKQKVTDPKDHAMDMRKAKRIHLYSIISALIVTIIAYLVL